MSLLSDWRDHAYGLDDNTPEGKKPEPVSKAKTSPAADSVKPAPEQPEAAAADAEPNVSASTKKAMEMFRATLHKV